MTVELGLTPDGRWDVDLGGLVAATCDAGFSALGVSVDRAGSQAKELLDGAGLRCHEVLALVLGADEAETVAAAERLATAAAAVGSPWVLTTFRAGLSDGTAGIIERCAGIFAEAGAKMAVEFSPLGPVSTIPMGLEIVDVAGHDRAGLMIDSWHFCFGDSTWEDLAKVPLERIAYVQFTDALAPGADSLMRETMNRRAVPGDGVLELDRFADTLLERGWRGTVSVEVLSSELRALPVPDVVRRLHDATASYWS